MANKTILNTTNITNTKDILAIEELNIININKIDSKSGNIQANNILNVKSKDLVNNGNINSNKNLDIRLLNTLTNSGLINSNDINTITTNNLYNTNNEHCLPTNLTIR